MSRSAYASDLSDAEWVQVEEIVPKVKMGGRPAKYERREIMNAIFYQVQSGGCCRMICGRGGLSSISTAPGASRVALNG